MTQTLFQAAKVVPLAEIKDVVSEHLTKLSSTTSPDSEALKIVRYEFPTEGLNPLFWLHNQPGHKKMYWSDPGQTIETAGLGSADEVTGEYPYVTKVLIDTLRSRLNESNPSLNYYGGFSFDHFNGHGPWMDYNHFRFVIPRFEMVCREGKTVFACNIPSGQVHTQSMNEIIHQLKMLDFDRGTTFKKVPLVQGRMDQPDPARWDNMINKVLIDIRAGKFDKIVLARQSTFSLDKAVNPVALLTHLKAITPRCYHFCIQLKPFHGFLGASPECLFKRTGRYLETEALAGTSPRGEDADRDQKLADALMTSDKNNREHAHVVTAVQSLLSEWCVDYAFDKTPQLWRSDNWQHLKTSFHGQLKEGISDDILLNHLHPTPAIAGCPKEKVLREISELEPFDRGWYAGLVGRVGHDTAEFCVAIRSALVDDNRLSLFAGAGIVDGSQAHDEWNEIEDKIINFLKVFKAHPQYCYESQ